MSLQTGVVVVFALIKAEKACIFYSSMAINHTTLQFIRGKGYITTQSDQFKTGEGFLIKKELNML